VIIVFDRHFQFSIQSTDLFAKRKYFRVDLLV
jgi:hypothetical protein